MLTALIFRWEEKGKGKVTRSSLRARVIKHDFVGICRGPERYFGDLESFRQIFGEVSLGYPLLLEVP